MSDVQRMHVPANRLLLAAAINADTALVKELLQNEADPNTHDSNKLTALHHAAFSESKKERAAVVESLLAAGADPNAVAFDLGTPLHIAMRYGAKDVVSALFTRNASANVRDGSSRPATAPTPHYMLSVHAPAAPAAPPPPIGSTALHMALQGWRSAGALMEEAPGTAPDNTFITNLAASSAESEPSPTPSSPSPGKGKKKKGKNKYAAPEEEEEKKDVLSLALLCLDNGADANLPEPSGALPPRWTREVLNKSRETRQKPTALRAFAFERACVELQELAEADRAAAKSKKKGGKGKKAK